jgi:C-terminal processing protease CtpA/Prc
MPQPPAKPTKPVAKPDAEKPLQPGGKLVGVGLQFMPMQQNAMKINQIHPGGGAEAAGLVVGDYVIAVAGTPVTQLGEEGTVAKVLGPANTQVAITLWRNGAPVTLMVDRIPPKKKLSLEFSDVSEVLERKISP